VDEELAERLSMSAFSASLVVEKLFVCLDLGFAVVLLILNKLGVLALDLVEVVVDLGVTVIRFEQ